MILLSSSEQSDCTAPIQSGLQITIRDPASQGSIIKCVESVCQFTAQLLSTEVAWPMQLSHTSTALIYHL